MLKRVSPRPDWLKAENVRDIYSVSACVSKDFADYINFWKHNGYWLFDSPDIMTALAKSQHIDLAGTTLFYYEVYEREYDEATKTWQEFKAEQSFGTDVQVPHGKTLEGFDVVCFWVHNNPECSPLSCNSVSENLLEAGQFDDRESGPFRIFAVYIVLP
jgi:hypothetical protein